MLYFPNDFLGSGHSLGFRSSVHSLKCLENANLIVGTNSLWTLTKGLSDV